MKKIALSISIFLCPAFLAFSGVTTVGGSGSSSNVQDPQLGLETILQPGDPLRFDLNDVRTSEGLVSGALTSQQLQKLREILEQHGSANVHGQGIDQSWRIESADSFDLNPKIEALTSEGDFLEIYEESR